MHNISIPASMLFKQNGVMAISQSIIINILTETFASGAHGILPYEFAKAFINEEDATQLETTMTPNLTQCSLNHTKGFHILGSLLMVKLSYISGLNIPSVSTDLFCMGPNDHDVKEFLTSCILVPFNPLGHANWHFVLILI